MNDSNQGHFLNDILSDINFLALDGKKTITFSELSGKAILVVNTASECGLTNQYSDLEALYQRYYSYGLVVLGVPCNDFGSQEPGSHVEILQFCENHYRVSFPMTEKVHVVGESAHPFYQHAKAILGEASIPQWNFHKYLINREGQLTHFFESPLSPVSDQIVKAIESTLGLSR